MQGGNKRKEEKGIGVGNEVGVGGEGKGGFFVQLWGVEVGVGGGWCGVVWYGIGLRVGRKKRRGKKFGCRQLLLSCKAQVGWLG